MHVSSREKIIALDALSTLRAHARRSDRRIAYANGFFDVIHAGHVSFLEHAANHCDWLVVGVLCDDMKPILKHKAAFVPEQDRIRTIAAFGCVSYAVLFREHREIMLPLVPQIIILSPTSNPQRNDEQRQLAESIGAQVIEIASESSIHSSELIERALAG